MPVLFSVLPKLVLLIQKKIDTVAVTCKECLHLFSPINHPINIIFDMCHLCYVHNTCRKWFFGRDQDNSIFCLNVILRWELKGISFSMSLVSTLLTLGLVIMCLMFFRFDNCLLFYGYSLELEFLHHLHFWGELYNTVRSVCTQLWCTSTWRQPGLSRGFDDFCQAQAMPQLN